jgi:accessory colonization factor AcfC
MSQADLSPAAQAKAFCATKQRNPANLKKIEERQKYSVAISRMVGRGSGTGHGMEPAAARGA